MRRPRDSAVPEPGGAEGEAAGEGQAGPGRQTEESCGGAGGVAGPGELKRSGVKLRMTLHLAAGSLWSW